jgi:hypothetical protein
VRGMKKRRLHVKWSRMSSRGLSSAQRHRLQEGGWWRLRAHDTFRRLEHLHNAHNKTPHRLMQKCATNLSISASIASAPLAHVAHDAIKHGRDQPPRPSPSHLLKHRRPSARPCWGGALPLILLNLVSTAWGPPRQEMPAASKHRHKTGVSGGRTYDRLLLLTTLSRLRR